MRKSRAAESRHAHGLCFILVFFYRPDAKKIRAAVQREFKPRRRFTTAPMRLTGVVSAPMTVQPASVGNIIGALLAAQTLRGPWH
jgi:hypothetical protein